MCDEHTRATLDFMLRFGTFLLWTAVAVALAGPVCLIIGLLLRGGPASLVTYQSLTAGLATVFVGGLALTGVLTTIAANARQRMEAVTSERRQVAAAFIGEIKTILHELSAPSLHEKLRALAAATDHPGPPAPVETVRISSDFTTFYRANAKEVGKFAAPMPEELTHFYGLFLSIKANLDNLFESLSRDVRLGGMTREQIHAATVDCLYLIEEARELGRSLEKRLGAVRDS